MARGTLSSWAAAVTAAALLAASPGAALGAGMQGETRPRTTRNAPGDGARTAPADGVRTAPADGARARLDASSQPAEASFTGIYQSFYDTYKLGPDDQIGVFITDEPDFSTATIKVSPVGRVTLPLVGEVEVVGLTIPQLTAKLTAEYGEYIRNPRLTVSLLEAQSAKVGVLGEVGNPGVLVMSRPMRVLDVITEVGGISDLGSKSRVTILRQGAAGGYAPFDVNVKRLLEGKGNSADNVAIRSGDIIIVHGNKWKTWAKITSLTGFSTFASFVGLGRGGVGSGL